jgi:hypothetical protein
MSTANEVTTKEVTANEEQQFEQTRRQLVNDINYDPRSREGLERKHGQVWDTQQLVEQFEVRGFLAPFVVVRDRKTGEQGSLCFQHDPRFYFGYQKTTK